MHACTHTTLALHICICAVVGVVVLVVMVIVVVIVTARVTDGAINRESMEVLKP